MDEKPDQIIGQIEAQRSELGRNLNELETRVRDTTNWRTHYERNPMMVLGAALGGGLLLGAVIGGGRSSSRKTWRSSSLAGGSMGLMGSTSGHDDARPSSSSYYTPTSGSGSQSSTGSGSPATSSYSHSGSSSAGGTLSNLMNSGHFREVTEALDHIKGALVAFGIAKAKEFLAQSVPGLEQHLGMGQQDSSGSNRQGSGAQGFSGAGDYGSGSDASRQSTGSGSQSGYSDYRSGSQMPGTTGSTGGGAGRYGTTGSGTTGSGTTGSGTGTSGSDYWSGQQGREQNSSSGEKSGTDDFAGAGTGTGRTPGQNP